MASREPKETNPEVGSGEQSESREWSISKRAFK